MNATPCRLVWFAVLSAALWVLSGCAQKTATPLRVGTGVWPGYEIFYLARSLGYLDESLVHLVAFPGNPQVQHSFQNHALEAAALPRDEPLQLAQSHSDLRIVLALDFSNGADGLIARPGVETTGDLRGKKIGLEFNSGGSLILARALEAEGLALTEVEVVGISSADQLAALRGGAVDAVVACDPVRAQLLNLGAVQLFDSSRIFGEVMDVLVVSKSGLKNHDQSVRHLLAGWFRAVDYLKKNPQDAARRMALRERLRPEEFLQVLRGLHILDLNENHRLLDAEKGTLQENMRRLSALMLRHGLLVRMPDPAPLLTDQVLKEARL